MEQHNGTEETFITYKLPPVDALVSVNNVQAINVFGTGPNSDTVRARISK